MPATSSIVMPAMLLPGVVMFPHALLPLRIFEPRYRKMLETALAGDCCFAVAGGGGDDEAGDWEGTIATVGIVRDRRLNDDGTSDLVVQGVWRGRVTNVNLEPFPRLRLKRLEESAGGSEAELSRARNSVLKAARQVSQLGGNVPRAILSFLNSVDEPSSFANTASHLLFDDLARRMRLLEAATTLKQMETLASSLDAIAAKRSLEKHLPGGSEDDDSVRFN